MICATTPMELKTSCIKNNNKELDNFLVTGLVRNCSKTIYKDILRLQTVFQKISNIHWLLIESDSDDNTVEKLQSLEKRVDNFRYLSLGNLQHKMPLRTQRIAYCRNKYLEELRKNTLYSEIRYVVIVDLDGINNLLTEKAFLTCWDKEGWDVCTANQKGPYYDIWALRHPVWSPNDCWIQQKFLQQYGLGQYDSIVAAVYSRMITISPEKEWIEVDSSFGGLAIYRRSVLEVGEYIGLNDDGQESCEHVSLHAQLKSFGYRIYINPKLINAAYTEHTKPLRLSRRILLKIKSILKQILKKLTQVSTYN